MNICDLNTRWYNEKKFILYNGGESSMRYLWRNYQLSYKASRFNTISTGVLLLITPFLPYIELLFISLIINYVQSERMISIPYFLIAASLFYIIKTSIDMWDLYVMNSRFKINKYFRETLWKYAHEMPFAHYVNKKQKDVYLRALDAINKGFLGPAGTIYQVKGVFMPIVLVLAVLVFSLYIDVLIFFILLIQIGVTFYFIWKINRIEVQKQEELLDQRIEAKQFESYITDVAYAKEMRIFQLNTLFLQKIRHLYRLLGGINDTYTDKMKRYMYGVELIQLTSFVITTFLVVRALQFSVVQIGTAILFMSMQLTLFNATAGLIVATNKLKTLVHLSREYYQFIDLIKAEQKQIQKKEQQFDHFESLEFVGVSFAYAQDALPILDHISFTIKQGDKICLIGINGSGKSTIIKLILGLLKPTEGMIRINNVNIEHIHPQTLNRLFFTIFQENVLYALSLKQNLDPHNQYEKSAIHHELFTQGLVDAQANIDDIHLTTYFHEDGKVYSGGEVQKIKYIQALLASTEVLLLDEPTSAMDLASEKQFFEVIFETFAHKTFILITHNVEMSKYFDGVIVLNQGKLMTKGTFQEVCKNEHFQALLQGEEV